MDNFIADLKHITRPKSSVTRNFKDEFSWIKSTALKQHYYTYHGSLTTVPYTECVIWVIFTQPIKISRKQVGIPRVNVRQPWQPKAGWTKVGRVEKKIKLKVTRGGGRGEGKVYTCILCEMNRPLLQAHTKCLQNQLKSA